MIAAAVVVAFVVTGSVYCRSLPIPSRPESSDNNIEPFIGIPAIRLARQSGKH